MEDEDKKKEPWERKQLSLEDKETKALIKAFEKGFETERKLEEGCALEIDPNVLDALEKMERIVFKDEKLKLHKLPPDSNVEFDKDKK